MVLKFFYGFCLIAITVAIHAIALGSLIIPQALLKTRSKTHFWPLIWLMIRVTILLIVLHLIEISVWALFYYWQECMPDLASAFYFSGVTYTTTGYGDLVLPMGWRLLGPIEGLTGILMCGLSTGFYFAFVSKEIWPRIQHREA